MLTDSVSIGSRRRFRIFFGALPARACRFYSRRAPPDPGKLRSETCIASSKKDLRKLNC